MKKFLAWLLIGMMIMTSLPMAALAAGDSHVHAALSCPGKNNVEDHNLGTVPQELLVYVGTIDPQCFDEGYDVFYCKGCDIYFDANFVDPDYEEDHDWKMIGDAVPPTCTEPGNKAKYQCTICKEIHNELNGDPIPATGHNLVVDPERNLGTCTYAGPATYVCTKCDYEEEGWWGGEGHDWELIEILDFPGVEDGTGNSCESAGKGLAVCTKCQTTKEVVIDPETDHWTHLLKEVPQIDPSCLTSGVKAYYVCERCGLYFYDAEGKELIGDYNEDEIYDELDVAIAAKEDGRLYIAPLGHDYVLSAKPSCSFDPKTNTGSVTNGLKVCQREGCLDTDPGHSAEIEFAHGYVFDEATLTAKKGVEGVDWLSAYIAPDCLVQGSYNERCKCGYVYIDEHYEALGHATYEEADVKNTVYNGCGKEAFRTWTCNHTTQFGVPCGAELSDSFIAPGHKASPLYEVGGTCVTDGYKFSYCLNPWCCTGTSTDKKATHVTYFNVPYSISALTSDVSYDEMLEEMENPTPVYFIRGSFQLTGRGDHVIENKKVNLPSCTEAGSEAGVCKYCHKWQTTILAPTGHNYGDSITVDPTCVSDGYTYQVCKNGCGIDLVDENSITKFNFGKYDPTNDVYDWILLDDPDAVNNLDWNTYSSREEAVEAGHVNLVDDKDAECIRHGTYMFVNGAWELAAGVYIYGCEKSDDPAHAGCGKKVIVIDILDEQDCEGWTYTCKCCGTEVDVPGFGHTPVEVPFQAPSCAAPGHMPYMGCSTCGDILSKAIVTIPQLTHTPGMLVDEDDPWDAFLGAYNYKYYDCIYCEGDLEGYSAGIVKDFAQHDFRHVDQGKPDCEIGYALYKCLFCDEHYEEVPVFHINAAGQKLTNICTDAPEDRLCVICNNEIGKDHKYLHNNGAATPNHQFYAATCTDPSYWMDICTVCNIENVLTDRVGVVDTKNGHETEWVILQAPTYLADGIKGEVCKLCEKILDTAPVDKLNIDLALDVHSIYDTDIVVDSSFIAVDVYMTAAEIEAASIWGAKMSVEFDEHLTFVGAVATGDDYLKDHLGRDMLFNCNAEDGIVHFEISTQNDDITHANTEFEGTALVATLYFQVDALADAAYADAVEASFGIVAESVEIRQFGGRDILGQYISNLIGYTVNEESATSVDIYALANMDDDLAVSLKDAQLAADLVVTGAYGAVADIDKDGQITLADFGLIYDWVIGKIDYNGLTEVLHADVAAWIASIAID